MSDYSNLKNENKRLKAYIVELEGKKAPAKKVSEKPETVRKPRK